MFTLIVMAAHQLKVAPIKLLLLLLLVSLVHVSVIHTGKVEHAFS